MTRFQEFCYHQHDVVVNQKYDDILPYSFHLNLVGEQVKKFLYLIDDEWIENKNNSFTSSIKLKDIILDGAYGHDLDEDARLTYNNYKDTATKIYNNSVAGELLADIIFYCTELRGKDRDERHGPDYIQGLRNNKYALFVKLCDIAANIGYGLLTNSSMYKKYQKEFPKFKEQLYREEFDDLFNYIEKLLTIKNQ